MVPVHVRSVSDSIDAIRFSTVASIASQALSIRFSVLISTRRAWKAMIAMAATSVARIKDPTMKTEEFCLM